MSVRQSLFHTLSIALTILLTHQGLGEGSKNLTPSATGSLFGTNNFVGYLEHDVNLPGDPFYFTSGNFLQPGADYPEGIYHYHASTDITNVPPCIVGKQSVSSFDKPS